MWTILGVAAIVVACALGALSMQNYYLHARLDTAKEEVKAEQARNMRFVENEKRLLETVDTQNKAVQTISKLSADRQRAAEVERLKAKAASEAWAKREAELLSRPMPVPGDPCASACKSLESPL